MHAGDQKYHLLYLFCTVAIMHAMFRRNAYPCVPAITALIGVSCIIIPLAHVQPAGVSCIIPLILHPCAALQAAENSRRLRIPGIII